MQAFEAAGIIGAAGGVGGLTAYLSSGGLRRKLTLEDGPSETGFVATIVVGAVAAVVAWAVQAPQAARTISGGLTPTPTCGDLVAAAGVGLAGMKWLGLHYQAKFFRFVGSKAAAGPANSEAAAAISLGDRAGSVKAVDAT